MLQYKQRLHTTRRQPLSRRKARRVMEQLDISFAESPRMVVAIAVDSTRHPVASSAANATPLKLQHSHARNNRMYLALQRARPPAPPASTPSSQPRATTTRRGKRARPRSPRQARPTSRPQPPLSYLNNAQNLQAEAAPRPPALASTPLPAAAHRRRTIHPVQETQQPDPLRMSADRARSAGKRGTTRRARERR